MQNKPCILVIGAGAIGGATAAFVAEAGYDVTIVAKYPEVAEKIQREGLRVVGIRGEHVVKMPAVATCQELKGTFDLVFHATKATDMLDVAREVLPHLHTQSIVVSLQNGLCEEQLAEVVGRSRVVGCVVGWGATLLAPAVVDMTSQGEFVIGNIDHRPDARLANIQTILSNVVPVEVSNEILANLYSKLIINACITSLGAVCGLRLGDMLNRRRVRSLFIGIMREAIAVADAMGWTIPTYGNKLNYYNFLRGSGIVGDIKRHFTVWFIGRKFRRLKSSSLQSLERGKPTEIDFLNGYIVAKGQQYNVPTPINARVVQLIHEIEAGKRHIGEANFEAFESIH